MQTENMNSSAYPSNEVRDGDSKKKSTLCSNLSDYPVLNSRELSEIFQDNVEHIEDNEELAGKDFPGVSTYGGKQKQDFVVQSLVNSSNMETEEQYPSQHSSKRQPETRITAIAPLIHKHMSVNNDCSSRKPASKRKRTTSDSLSDSDESEYSSISKQNRTTASMSERCTDSTSMRKASEDSSGSLQSTPDYKSSGPDSQLEMPESKSVTPAYYSQQDLSRTSRSVVRSDLTKRESHKKSGSGCSEKRGSRYSGKQGSKYSEESGSRYSERLGSENSDRSDSRSDPEVVQFEPKMSRDRLSLSGSKYSEENYSRCSERSGSGYSEKRDSDRSDYMGDIQVVQFEPQKMSRDRLSLSGSKYSEENYSRCSEKSGSGYSEKRDCDRSDYRSDPQVVQFEPQMMSRDRLSLSGSKYSVENYSRCSEKSGSGYSEKRDSDRSDYRSDPQVIQFEPQKMSQDRLSLSSSKYCEENYSRCSEKSGSGDSDRSDYMGDPQVVQFEPQKMSRDRLSLSGSKYSEENYSRCSEKSGSRYSERSHSTSDPQVVQFEPQKMSRDRLSLSGSKYSEENYSRCSEKSGSGYSEKRDSDRSDYRSDPQVLQFEPQKMSRDRLSLSGSKYSEENYSRCSEKSGSRYSERSHSTSDPQLVQFEPQKMSRDRLSLSGSKYSEENYSRCSEKSGSAYSEKRDSDRSDYRSDPQVVQFEPQKMSRDRLSLSSLSGNSSRTDVLKSRSECYTPLSRFSKNRTDDRQSHWHSMNSTHGKRSAADVTPFSPLTTSSESSPMRRTKRARTGAFIPSYDLNAINLKPPVRVIDSHCHLDFLFTRENYYGSYSSYRLKHRETFPDCYEGCITIICEPQNFFRKHEWDPVLQEDGVWAAYGCHPHMVNNYSDKAEDALIEALKDPKVIALGEIGLDYSKRNNCNRALQQEVLRRQLKIALKHEKPLVIHCREAHEDCMGIMKELVPRDHPIHLHCFTDTWQRGAAWLKEFPNLYIGITNVVTFPSAEDVHETARNIPIDRLLLETDTPYFVPRSVSRRWSHPGLVIHAAAQISAFRTDVQLEDLLKTVRNNTYKVYGI